MEMNCKKCQHNILCQLGRAVISERILVGGLRCPNYKRRTRKRKTKDGAVNS